jgi:hypothetical protein
MMSSGRPAQETAGLYRILDRRQFDGAGEARVAHRRDLLVGQCPHQTQFAEHCHVLFVMRGGLAHRLLAGGRDVKLVAERQPLTQFEADATLWQVFRKSCFGPDRASQLPHRLQRVCSPA